MDAISKWERGMIEALYANGMVGGDDFTKQLDSIQAHAEELRIKASSTDLDEVEEELSKAAPYPVTAEANPDGA